MAPDCPIENFGKAWAGERASLYRSGQPRAEGLRWLARIGVDTIFKLSHDNDYPLEKERGEFGGEVRARPLPSSLFRQEAIVRIADEIEAELAGGRTVLVHCMQGQNRTGIVVGAWGILHRGWSFPQARASRQPYGSTWNVIAFFRMENLWRRLAERGSVPAERDRDSAPASPRRNRRA